MNHRDLINIAHKIGYTQISNAGLCHGFSMMWIQAICNDGLGQFNNRMNLLNQYLENPQFLVSEIERVRSLAKSNRSLSDKDKEILEIPAFFEGIVLYQDPSINQAVFNQELAQLRGAETISLYTQPVSAKSEGLSTKMKYNEYNKEQLDTYIKSLAKQLENKPQVGIAFGSLNHTVSVRYIGNNLFEYMDTNVDTNTASPLIADKFTGKQLGNALRRSFFSTKKGDQLIISTQLFANDPELIKNISLGNDEQLTALSQDLRGYNLLMAALVRQDQVLFNNIDLDKVNLSDTCLTPPHKGWTALHFACMKKDHKNIALLLEKGAKVDIGDADNTTPLMLAVVLRDIDTIRLLIEKNPNSCNIREISIISPLYTASWSSDVKSRNEIIALLLPYSKLNMFDIRPESTLFKAMQTCPSEIKLKFLEEGLKTYIEERKQENQFFSDVFNLGFGYTKEEKIAAAQNLLDHIRNPAVKLEKVSMDALNEGRVRELFRFYQGINNKPDQDFAKDATTNSFISPVSELTQNASVIIEELKSKKVIIKDDAENNKAPEVPSFNYQALNTRYKQEITQIKDENTSPEVPDVKKPFV